MDRISLVHQGALGDTVLFVPLLRALRRGYTGARITLVTRLAFGRLLAMLGHVDAWASAEDREHAAWFAMPETVTVPNSRPGWAACDMLVSAMSTGGDAWAANAAAAGAGRVVCFHPRPPTGYAGHVTAYHREQLAGAGVALGDAPAAALVENPEGAVVIHPGSGGEAKCWPRGAYLRLAGELARQGVRTEFVVGEAELERWGGEAIAELRRAYPTYIDMWLCELAERLGQARLYVGNDSGVSHLAGALGVRSLVLFGPSDPVQWAPVGAAVTVLRAPVPTDMGSLEVGTVWEAVRRSLAGG